MYKLDVITPCSRPENLDKLFVSLLPGLRLFELHWHIVFDADRPARTFTDGWIDTSAIRGGVVGKLQINYALDNCGIPNNAWVWVLDDDNLAHHNFFNALAECIRDNPDARGFIFKQWINAQQIRDNQNIRVGHIDQAQYVVRRDLIGDKPYEQNYEADGRFIVDLVAEHGDSIVRVPRPVTFYNRLRWSAS